MQCDQWISWLSAAGAGNEPARAATLPAPETLPQGRRTPDAAGHGMPRSFFTQTRVADGVWLPACVRINAHAKILLIKSHDVDEVITYSDYQKADRAIASSASPSLGPHVK